MPYNNNLTDNNISWYWLFQERFRLSQRPHQHQLQDQVLHPRNPFLYSNMHAQLYIYIAFVFIDTCLFSLNNSLWTFMFGSYLLSQLYLPSIMY